MFVYKKDNGELVFPVVWDNIKYLIPDVSLPATPTSDSDLTDFGFYQYRMTSQPSHSVLDHRVEEDSPLLIDREGMEIYIQQWKLIPLTDEEKETQLKNKMMEFTKLIQFKLDSMASKMGYDNIVTACSYINSTQEKWRREAIGLSKWRDECWMFLQNEQNKMLSTKIIPTEEEIAARLPALII